MMMMCDLPPASLHGGVLYAQTGDGRMSEEVQRQEEAQGRQRSQVTGQRSEVTAAGGGGCPGLLSQC